jgi:SAM-dependent methyltransferase
MTTRLATGLTMPDCTGQRMIEQFYRDRFTTFLCGLLDGRTSRVEILEVGAGSHAAFPVEGARYTVIDNSEASASRSDFADEVIIADAETFSFPESRFDVAVFQNVLEHLPNPEAALLRAAGALKPSGVLVVAGPILDSLKSRITRYTPFWLHILVYRHVFGVPHAGKPGHSPFPVVHARSASPEEIRSLLATQGFRQCYFDSYEGIQPGRLAERLPWAYSAYKRLAQLFAPSSERSYSALDTEFILAMQAPDGEARSEGASSTAGA